MGSSPEAQGSISVSFPSRVASGPDYATEVLGDPWDMCNLEDISRNPDQVVGLANFGFVAGPCRVGGATVPVNGSADSNFMVLDRGLYGVAINPGRNGRNFPIDPNRYRIFSYKLSSSTAENPQVYWFQNPIIHPAGDGLGGRLLPPSSAGTQIAFADLTQSLIPGLVPWTSGLVRGLRLDPNSASFGNVFFHWIRLTTPSGQSGTPGNQNISWSGGSGNATITVRDNSDGTTMVVASGVSGTSILWNYGVLAPGNYTLTVTRTSGSGSTSFSINNPPSIAVTNPSQTSGPDYATTVFGNPWDMSDAADVQPTVTDHFTTPSFSGGIMTATNTTDDPNVNLLFHSNNGVPIDTSRYRYLTIRFQVDGPYDLGAGSVARFLWASGPAITTNLPFLVWPGMNSYTIDLATLTTAPDGGLEADPGAESWTAANKTHFRFDPHEFPQARTFHIDDVKLTAKPAGSGIFTIGFQGADADGDAATVSLYYDTDSNPNNGRTLIASGIPQSAGQFNWNTAGVPFGEYFIYAESSDGIQVTGRYSMVPVQLVGAATTPSGLRIIR
jgi:hypothetical protein